MQPIQPPCACGSGLRHLRCCGLDLSSLAPPEASRHLAPLAEQARQASAEGRAEAAERLCLEVLELAPGHPDMLWLLSRLHDAKGQAGPAEVLVRRLVAINPNLLGATHDLARRLMLRGAFAQAEPHARNAVRVAPEDATSHNLLGMALTELHQPVAGDFHLRRVLALTAGTGRRDPTVLANLAWSLKLQGRMAEARALYAESVAAAPETFHTLLSWALLEEADRDFARAAELVLRAEALSPGHPRLRLLRAVLEGRTGDTQAALALLEALPDEDPDDGTVAGAGLGPEQLMEKGRLLDRMGRHDDAFAAFDAGRARLRALGGQAYAAEHAEGLAARLAGFFTARRLATLPRAGIRTDGPQPLFILGFPRSGTTLVEQTLTAHPLIAAGDELPFVAELTELMPRLLGSPLAYPEALSELWMGDRRDGLDTLRDHYLQRVRQRGILTEGATLFTDKMPLNETHLGLIALIFPAAPLIHVQRHPLDVVLSVYSNFLTHGFHCATALETAARHYVLVADLVERYRAEMTLRYLPIRYEALVTDQEREVRRMLDFVGVDFDPACLRFHENRRYARTASYAQVTEPLYDRSRERWRKYRRHLAPVVPILQPVLDRMGYES